MEAMTVNKSYPCITLLSNKHNGHIAWIPPDCDADSITVDQGRHGSFRKPLSRHFIVAQRGTDNRVLVLWMVSSGYRGSASIDAGAGVRVIGYDHSWHSGRGNLGETAEMLAVMRPGDTLTAEIGGRRVQEDQARLTWTGTEFEVIFKEKHKERHDDENISHR